MGKSVIWILLLLFLCGCDIRTSNGYIEIRDAITHKPFTDGYIKYQSPAIGTFISHKSKAVNGRYHIGLYGRRYVVANLEIPNLDIALRVYDLTFDATSEWSNISDRNWNVEFLENNPLEVRCLKMNGEKIDIE